MALQAGDIVTQHRNILEAVVFGLCDAFHIRIVWDRQLALWVGALGATSALVGGQLGAGLGAGLGAALGAGLGFGARTLVSLREIRDNVKELMVELLHIVYNFLRRLDPIDFVQAVEILLRSRSSSFELVQTMSEFIAQKLGRQVLSSLVAS